MKTRTRYTRYGLFALLCLVAGFLFKGCIPKEMEEKQILVVWESEEGCLIYEHWTEEVEQSFARRGIEAHVSTIFLDESYDYGMLPREWVAGRLQALDSMGRQPDLVLCHGDFSLATFNSMDDSLSRPIPLVGFGILSPNRFEEGGENALRENATCLYREIDLKKNLDFIDFFFPDSHRFVSVLEWTEHSDDAYLMDSLQKQMEALDTTHYYPGLTISEHTKQELIHATDTQGRVSLQIYSLLDNYCNRYSNGEQENVRWAFFSNFSHNHFLMLKHDRRMCRLVGDVNFATFCTTASEEFEVNALCIGGYFCPFEQQIDDAVTTCMQVLGGYKACMIPFRMHQSDYYVNYAAVRDVLALKDIPSQYHLRGVTFYDRHPMLFYLILGGAFFLIVGLLFLSIRYTYHTRRRNKEAFANLIKQAEANAERRELIRVVLRNAKVLTWHVTDNKFIIDDRSDTFLGSFEELTVGEALDGFSPEERGRIMAFFEESRVGDYDIQIHGGPAEGDNYWLEMHMHVRRQDHSIARRGVTINIDEIKRVEEEALEAHRLLVSAEERENFLTMMNHEIRTPLNSIVGFSQMLATPGLEISPEELAELGQTIRDNNDALMKIISDMLLITHIENGTLGFKMEYCRPADCIYTMAATCEALRQRKHVTVQVEGGPADAMVWVDMKQLKTISENLLSNAIKFSPENGTVYMGWRVVDGEVQLYIRDEGVGIADEHIPQLYKKFFKADPFSPGLGLGLTIVKGFVDSMGGRVAVSSNLGEGTTFSLCFKNVIAKELHEEEV